MINTIPTRKTAHMRGIKQAIEEIKQADPYTALTEKALRRRCYPLRYFLHPNK